MKCLLWWLNARPNHRQWKFGRKVAKKQGNKEMIEHHTDWKETKEVWKVNKVKCSIFASLFAFFRVETFIMMYLFTWCGSITRNLLLLSLTLCCFTSIYVFSEAVWASTFSMCRSTCRDRYVPNTSPFIVSLSSIKLSLPEKQFIRSR